MACGQHKPVKDEEAAGTRRSTLHMVEQLFMAYRAVSRRQSADACGMRQPALYHYFSDKQSLYVEVIEENVAKTRKALGRIMRRYESIQELLRRIVRYRLTSSPQHRLVMPQDIWQELDVQAQEGPGELFHTGIIGPLASSFEEGLQQEFLPTSNRRYRRRQGSLYPHASALRQLSRSSRQESPVSNEHAEMMTQIFLYSLARTERMHDQGRQG